MVLGSRRISNFQIFALPLFNICYDQSFLVNSFQQSPVFHPGGVTPLFNPEGGIMSRRYDFAMQRHGQGQRKKHKNKLPI